MTSGAAALSVVRSMVLGHQDVMGSDVLGAPAPAAVVDGLAHAQAVPEQEAADRLLVVGDAGLGKAGIDDPAGAVLVAKRRGRGPQPLLRLRVQEKKRGQQAA